jgi:hypothetical protein
MVINVPRIYVALDKKQVEFQSHMIEVEGKIIDQPIDILIDLGASHSYLYPKIVENFQFPRSKLRKPWLVQSATGEKRKINEMVKTYLMDMNGLCTKTYLNIIPLGSYDFLISMDWLDEHHVFMDCYNKAFTCLDEQKFEIISRNSKSCVYQRNFTIEEKLHERLSSTCITHGRGT